MIKLIKKAKLVFWVHTNRPNRLNKTYDPVILLRLPSIRSFSFLYKPLEKGKKKTEFKESGVCKIFTEGKPFLLSQQRNIK
jgi:hypothetical protein